MIESLPGLEMPQHPGRPNMTALELAYDGQIPFGAKVGADLADGRLHDEWVRKSRSVLVRYALRSSYAALKNTGQDAFMQRAAAAGIVAAVLSQPEMQEL